MNIYTNCLAETEGTFNKIMDNNQKIFNTLYNTDTAWSVSKEPLFTEDGKQTNSYGKWAQSPFPYPLFPTAYDYGNLARAFLKRFLFGIFKCLVLSACLRQPALPPGASNPKQAK